MIIIDGKLATPNDPWVTHCGFCGRPETVCDADAHGCGTTPAQDATSAIIQHMVDDANTRPRTWRDRDKLL